MQLEGNPDTLTHPFQLALLIDAAGVGDTDARDSVLPGQLWQQQFRCSVQHQQFLTARSQCLAQRLHALEEEAFTLGAKTGHVAPRARTRPEEHAQQLIGLRVLQQPGVVLQTQVIAEPVYVSHVTQEAGRRHELPAATATIELSAARSGFLVQHPHARRRRAGAQA